MKKLVAGEIFLAYISVTLTTGVLFLPYLIAGVAFQDAWISVIIGTLGAIPFTLVGLALVNRFPEKGLKEILEEILGKFIGKILGLVYTALFLYISALVIRQLEEFFILAIMPETPPLAFRILYVLVLMLGVYEGTLAILRTNVYVVPVGVIVIGLVVLLATTKMDIDNLTPIFSIELEGILAGSFLTIGWLLQFPLLVLIFFKYLETAKLKYKIRLEGVLSVIVVGIAMIAGALSTTAVFGPRQTATLLYPAFNMARVIEIGGFLEHVEITFVAVWVAGMYITATIYCYMGVLLFASVLGIEKETKKIAIPMAATLLYLPTLIARDLATMFAMLRYTFPALVIAFGGILPTFFLVLSVALNKGISPRELKNLQKEAEKTQTAKSNFGEPKSGVNNEQEDEKDQKSDSDVENNTKDQDQDNQKEDNQV